MQCQRPISYGNAAHAKPNKFYLYFHAVRRRHLDDLWVVMDWSESQT